jgi:hypothetical protein
VRVLQWLVPRLVRREDHRLQLLDVERRHHDVALVTVSAIRTSRVRLLILSCRYDPSYLGPISWLTTFATGFRPSALGTLCVPPVTK